MSRRVALPAPPDVADALDALLTETAADGTRATVVELARRVGLTNSTFWRHFPDTAQQLRDASSGAAAASPGAAVAHRYAELAQRAAGLAGDNAQLREHLDLAAAHIARLTLDNHRLTRELEAATGVHHLPRPHPAD
jgi:AcrR family transcriptional regulator